MAGMTGGRMCATVWPGPMRPSACSRAGRGATALAMASFLGGWILAGPLQAGTAHLVEGGGPDRVVVEASDATTDEILGMLAKHFAFAVERTASASQPVRLSGRL